MDDLIAAVADVLEKYPIAASPNDAQDAARDAIAAILRVHGSKPDPIAAAYRAGWFGSKTYWRGASPDRGFAEWNQRRLDAPSSSVVD